jgi:hypothetical protein
MPSPIRKPVQNLLFVDSNLVNSGARRVSIHSGFPGGNRVGGAAVDLFKLSIKPLLIFWPILHFSFGGDFGGDEEETVRAID